MSIRILPNGVAVIDGDSHHAVWCETEGLVHDKWMAFILTRIIKHNSVKLAIDAGANIGTLSRPMLDAGVKVIGFEPNPDAASCYAINCPEATLIRKGLADKPGKMVVVKHPNAAATYLQPIAEITGDICEITTLDDYYAGPGMHAPLPGLIKWDIEGCELKALRGAEQTINRSRPVMVMEISYHTLPRHGAEPRDVYQWLLEHGYKWKILQREATFESMQYDIEATP